MQITSSAEGSFLERLIRRFGGYTLVGVSTFMFDLVLIWVFLTAFNWNEAWSIGVAFFIAVHINYSLLRFWVYRNSPEKVSRTYSYFIVLATSFSILIPYLVILVNDVLGWEMLISRVVVAGIIGMIGFAFNTFLNFKFL